MIMLIIIDDARGKKNTKFLPSILISPGNLPKTGMRSQKVTINPAITSTIPVIIRNFPAEWNSFILKSVFNKYKINEMKLHN